MNATIDRLRAHSLLLGVFALAWLVRFVVLVQLSDHPSFRMPLVDAGEYHTLAARLATGQGRVEQLSWQPWFYPVILSWLYRLTGVSVWAAKLLQITAGAATCAVAAAIGRRLGGRGVGALAGVAAALYGPMVYLDGELLAESWAGLWLALTAWLALSVRDRAGVGHAVALGALGALCLFTRPPLIPAWGVAALAAVAVGRRHLPAERWLGGLLIGTSMAAAPFLLAVQGATGKMALLPSTGGINFYIGNSDDPCRTINIRPGYQWEILTQWPAVEGAVTAEAMDRFFSDQARAAIAADPAAWLKHLATKTAQFVSSREIPRNIEIYALREHAPLLAALAWKIEAVGFPFGLIAGLVLLGLGAGRRGDNRTATATLLVMTLAYAGGIILIHVCDRYRLPVLPLLLPVAAAGAWRMWETARARSWGTTAGHLSVLTATAAATSLAGPFCAERLDYKAELDRLIATYAFEARDVNLAETYARSALARNPDEANAWNQLGLVHAVRGQLDDARACFEKAVASDPAMGTAWFNLAKAAVNTGDTAGAVLYYETGLAAMPGHLNARLDYGDLLFKQGETERARAAYNEVLRIKPSYPPALQRIDRTNRKPKAL